MGCDIHMYAEVKKDDNWEKVGKIFKAPYYDPEKPSNIDGDGYDWNAEFTDAPYDDRNYDLFALLADVRNGYGFAGCDTGDAKTPISMPKGIPKDVSQEIKKYSDEWGCDGHSHSWLTVQELLDYDWNQVTIQRGWVGLKQYRIFKKESKPKSWSGGVSGDMVKNISNEEADMLLDINLDEIIKKDKDNKLWNLLPHFYTQVEWSEGYNECAKYFLSETLVELQKLGSPKNVRIVFWFDN